MLDKRAYLSEMGIEVWQLRSNVVVSRQDPPSHGKMARTDAAPAKVKPAPAPSRQARLVDTATEKPSPAAPVVHAQPPPSFSLSFLHYGQVGICVSMEPGKKLPRRLCDDLAGLMGGDVKALRYQRLDWPMVKNSAIDQSIDSAREVVTQKFSQMPARVLVIGEDLSLYYGPAVEFRPDQPVSVGRQSFLLVPSMQKLMTSAVEKKQLMKVLKEWQ